MKKIRLNAEDLQVESFPVLPSERRRFGTVKGYDSAIDEIDGAGSENVDSCHGTCKATCQTMQCGTCPVSCGADVAAGGIFGAPDLF